MEQEQTPKSKMPQLNEETGMSSDFKNETFAPVMRLNREGIESVAEMIRQKPLKKYEERFSSNIFENVVTEKNKSAVERLDGLVERLNNLAVAGTLTREEFVTIYNEIQDLVSGSMARHIE